MYRHRSYSRFTHLYDSHLFGQLLVNSCSSWTLLSVYVLLNIVGSFLMFELFWSSSMDLILLKVKLNKTGEACYRLIQLDAVFKISITHCTCVVVSLFCQHYRLYVISRCPQLINFDMCTVSKAERQTAATLAKSVASSTSSKKPKKSKWNIAESDFCCNCV